MVAVNAPVFSPINCIARSAYGTDGWFAEPSKMRSFRGLRGVATALAGRAATILPRSISSTSRRGRGAPGGFPPCRPCPWPRPGGVAGAVEGVWTPARPKGCSVACADNTAAPNMKPRRTSLISCSSSRVAPGPRFAPDSLRLALLVVDESLGVRIPPELIFSLDPV